MSDDRDQKRAKGEEAGWEAVYMPALVLVCIGLYLAYCHEVPTCPSGEKMKKFERQTFTESKCVPE